MLKCRPQSHLDLILPLKGNIQQQQQKQKCRHDAHFRIRTFKPNDNVLVRNFRTAESQWLPGVIKELNGTNSYKVQLDNDHIVQQHADHIWARQTDCVFPASSNDYDDVLPCPIAVPTFTSDEATPSIPRRSQRNRQPPDRFKA